MLSNRVKNKSRLWTQQLFWQNCTYKALPQSKTHYSHFYLTDRNKLNDNPFQRLFSNESNNPPYPASNETGFHKLFQDELIGLNGRYEQIQHPVNSRSTGMNMTEGRLCQKGVPISSQFTVLDCFEETRDTKTFRLQRADGQQFVYLPGQYLTLTIAISGKEYKRSYSLASTPTRPGYLEITVKRNPNGGVISNWLNDNLIEGDIFTMKGPYGQFTCAKAVPPKILFLAAGSGIVPIMSMLRWLADTNARTDIVLLLSFRTQYDIIFGEELKLIGDRHNNIKLFITLTKEPLNYSQWAGLTGRVSNKMIVVCVPDVSERVVYQCGPDAFMTETKQYLQALGVPKGQLFSENFTVNAAQVPKQAAMRNYSIGRPSRNQTGSHRIRFAKSGKTVTANRAITLLELAEQSGIAIAHECRAGNCGECMVKCLKGNIEMTEQAEIADIERLKGWVYACCSYPVSNVVLDI
jgi:glycine betaine catabolism B